MADEPENLPNPLPESMRQWPRFTDTVLSDAEWRALQGCLTKSAQSEAEAQDRIFDMLLCDNDSARREARLYLGRMRPDLANRLYRAIPVKVKAGRP